MFCRLHNRAFGSLTDFGPLLRWGERLRNAVIDDMPRRMESILGCFGRFAERLALSVMPTRPSSQSCSNPNRTHACVNRSPKAAGRERGPWGPVSRGPSTFYVGVTRPRRELALVFQEHHPSPWVIELYDRSPTANAQGLEHQLCSETSSLVSGHKENCCASSLGRPNSNVSPACAPSCRTI